MKDFDCIVSFSFEFILKENKFVNYFYNHKITFNDFSAEPFMYSMQCNVNVFNAMQMSIGVSDSEVV